jgi:hypothetical protein
MKILIEHYEGQSEFAEQLAKRLRTIKETEVETYSDLITQNPEINNEILTKSFKKYDVIIPIIAGSYSENTDLSGELETFSELENKFLLPLIYDDTQWSSVNWIVKNKVFPEDGSPFEELSEKLKASTLKKLTTTIEEIIFQKNIKKSTPATIVNKDNVVFISHSHNDADFAELLKLQLEKNGINGWMDNEKLKIGQDWRQEIDEGITKSIALIVIMSPEAKNSEYVTYEWAYGWGKSIPIFPIMLIQTPLHPRLESLQYLDFTNRITRPWQKLIESINGLKK